MIGLALKTHNYTAVQLSLPESEKKSKTAKSQQALVLFKQNWRPSQTMIPDLGDIVIDYLGSDNILEEKHDYCYYSCHCYGWLSSRCIFLEGPCGFDPCNKKNSLDPFEDCGRCMLMHTISLCCLPITCCALSLVSWPFTVSADIVANIQWIISRKNEIIILPPPEAQSMV